ncbi:MAG: hypothetical protein FWD68_16000 [Alphaproteobacteria bacterium]|nr:hypothetical protein [Alphaproteobacteria bacterium]
MRKLVAEQTQRCPARNPKKDFARSRKNRAGTILCLVAHQFNCDSARIMVFLEGRGKLRESPGGTEVPGSRPHALISEQFLSNGSLA